jgi:hypothetical protein
LKAFGAQFRPDESVAGDVSPGAGEARDQTVGHRISHAAADDWYGAGRALCRENGWSAHCHDHVDVKVHKLIRSLAKFV